jgi:hypothetical protein
VTFIVAPNLIGERTGTLTIAGEPLTVIQTALLPGPTAFLVLRPGPRAIVTQARD